MAAIRSSPQGLRRTGEAQRASGMVGTRCAASVMMGLCRHRR